MSSLQRYNQLEPFVLLFFACLDYSGMARAAGVSDDVTEGLCWIVCILLLGRSG